MDRIKIGKYFYLDEFVDPHSYFNRMDNGIGLIDNRLILIADYIREKHGHSIVINDWWITFKSLVYQKTLPQIVDVIEKSVYIRKWSGIRTERCKIGSKISAHRQGLAIDIKGNSRELYQITMNNLKPLYNLGLRRIEDISITPTWLHIDLSTKNVPDNHVRIISQTSGRNIKVI